MDSIGQQLHLARARKKSSLEDAAKATKIKVDYLAAMEADDYSRLPAPVYIKGFLKSYGNYLGLDGIALAEVFSMTYGDGAPQAPLVIPAPNSAATAPQPIQLHPRRVGIALAFLAVALVIFVGWRWWERRASHLPSTTVATTAPKPNVPAPPKNAAPVAPVAPPREFYLKAAVFDEVLDPPASAAIQHTLAIKASEPCGMKIEGDGRVLYDDILKRDQKVEFAAQKFHLILRNAGGVTVTFDGKPLPKLGNLNQRVEKTLPAPAAPR